MADNVEDWLSPIGYTDDHRRILEKFHCEVCGRQYTEEQLKAAVLIYGVFFLIGTEDHYIGTNCSTEGCQRTITVNIAKDDFEHAYELISCLSRFLWAPGAAQKHFSSVHFSPDQIPELRDLPVHTWHSQFCESNDIKAQEAELEDYLRDHPSLSTEYYCSYPHKGVQPLGEFTVWWFRKKDIKELVALENNHKTRIFPRHVFSIDLFEKINDFCWRYFLYEQYLLDFEKQNNARIAAKKHAPQCLGLSRDEIIEKDPYIILPDQVESAISSHKKFNKWEIRKTSSLFEILSSDLFCNYLPEGLRALSVPEANSFPFEMPEIPEPKLFDASHKEMVDAIIPILNKGHIQDRLRNESIEFIKDYIKLFRQQGFCYETVWNLKERYLNILYSIKDEYEQTRKKRKPGPYQRHKSACRKVAKKIWAKDPTMTIVDMSKHKEIFEACDREKYKDKETIRGWINDLCPNRAPGRRSNKKK